jgi:glucan phosphoethanolaminetransferase (alkaline phosphatase superfamily)
VVNKKGQVFGIIVFFLIMFTILIIGFIAVMSVGILSFVSDELNPILKEVGVSSENSDLEHAINLTMDTTDSFVQSLPWVIGFGYVMALIFTLVFVMVYRENPHPAFMGLFVALMFLLLMGAIIMSNMYQDIYNSNDFLGDKLKENYLMSYMILYSPQILILITFIAGVIMFSTREEYGGGL